MRPVDKGINHKKFSQYTDARPDLYDILGPLCSFCEMNISNMGEVEHVVPKKKDETLLLEWSNFLLACKYCNTRKNDNNDDRIGYFFPDETNTAYVFVYSKEKIIEPNPLLTETEKEQAKRTIELLNLNKTSLEARQENRQDNRERFREIAWSLAEIELEEYETNYKKILADFKDNPTKQIEYLERLSAITAKLSLHSYVSIWMNVFERHSMVLKEIIKRSTGIRKECFDHSGYAYQGCDITPAHENQHSMAN